MSFNPEYRAVWSFVQEPLPEESTIDLVRIEALLGNLPAEIRRHVPFTLEYDEPKALVHTSPVYHQQYLLGRQHLLHECLVTTSYRDHHSQSQYYSLLKLLTLDQLISMMVFHFSIIKSLTQYYTGWTLDNLTKETQDPQSKSLNRTEETRIVRALYRFQLYCNIFGVSRYKFTLVKG